MQCSECGFQNISGAKYCRNCGQKLAGQLCPACKHINPDDYKFCEECGHDFSLQQCPECQHFNSMDYRFCEECGHDFSVPEPEQAAEIPDPLPDKSLAQEQAPIPEIASQPTVQASKPVMAPPPSTQTSAPAPYTGPPVYYRPYPEQTPKKSGMASRVFKLIFGSVMGYITGVLGNYLVRIVIAFVQVNFVR